MSAMTPISREACTELGIITVSFPTMGKVANQMKTTSPPEETPYARSYDPTM